MNHIFGHSLTYGTIHLLTHIHVYTIAAYICIRTVYIHVHILMHTYILTYIHTYIHTKSYILLYAHVHKHRSEIEHLIRDGLVQHVLTDDHF